ncbi:MAG: biopolymer transporter ExbD [Phycisphaerales bacterium]|nr:biopolymer transporter ExbD [Phycisphaerales bacterium]
MRSIHQRGPVRAQASLTPMIDVVFLLVVFFVAVSQLVDRDRIDMDLPSPSPSAAHQPEDGARAVVNVLPGPEGTSIGYQVDGLVFAADATGQAALVNHLQDRLEQSPDLFVNVRADRGTAWGWVAPVLGAARGAAAMAGQPMARVRLIVEPGAMQQ